MSTKPREQRYRVVDAHHQGWHPTVANRILIFSERHLRTVLAEYGAHYNGRRPHRALQLLPPRSNHPTADLTYERIRRRPVLGGLINEYERAA
jgi:hypothetical protein